jgi:hypothetical protein
MLSAPERRISSAVMISIFAGTSVARWGDPVALVVTASPNNCSSEP